LLHFFGAGIDMAKKLLGKKHEGEKELHKQVTRVVQQQKKVKQTPAVSETDY